MKAAIILCCVVTLGSCGPFRSKKDADDPGHFMDLMKMYGYPAESYDVQTEDGYILEMFRISKGKKSEEDRSSSSSSEEYDDKKGVVFLMHGLMTTAESFVYGGPSESMAMMLADEGYDVFLGNARGSVYGQKHTKLDPQKDAAFWKFCFDDIGKKDLTAMVDKALSVSGKSKLSHIGHNEGTTSFYVMLAEKPEYNSKFDRHISLGPMVYMEHADDEIIDEIEEHISSKAWIMKNVGINSFVPSKGLVETAASNCKSKNIGKKICEDIFFLFNGYNSEHLNMTTIDEVMSRVPSYVSVREILHFTQLKKNGKYSNTLHTNSTLYVQISGGKENRSGLIAGGFKKYSEEGSEGKDYDLSKVTVPVALLCTPEDPLSHTEDVKHLKKDLPNVYHHKHFEDLTNNIDLLWSEHMEKVHEEVKKALEESTEKA